MFQRDIKTPQIYISAQKRNVCSSSVKCVLRPASVRALSRLCAIQKFRGCTSKNSGGCVNTCSCLNHVEKVYSSRVSAPKDQYCAEDRS